MVEEKLPGGFLTPKVRWLCVHPLLQSLPQWEQPPFVSDKDSKKKWSWLLVGGIWRRLGKSALAPNVRPRIELQRTVAKKDRKINHPNQPWNEPFLYSAFWLIQGSAGPLMRSVSHDCWGRRCSLPLETVYSRGTPVLRDYLVWFGK